MAKSTYVIPFTYEDLEEAKSAVRENFERDFEVKTINQPQFNEDMRFRYIEIEENNADEFLEDRRVAILHHEPFSIDFGDEIRSLKSGLLKYTASEEKREFRDNRVQEGLSKRLFIRHYMFRNLLDVVGFFEDENHVTGNPTSVIFPIDFEIQSDHVITSDTMEEDLQNFEEVADRWDLSLSFNGRNHCEIYDSQHMSRTKIIIKSQPDDNRFIVRAFPGEYSTLSSNLRLFYFLKEIGDDISCDVVY